MLENEQWFVDYYGDIKDFPYIDVEDVHNAPAVDAVEVVRCKDCKHFTEGMAVGMCKRIDEKPILPIPYNHFCSFGERREENAAD